MGLVALVDHGRGGLEAVPDVLTLLLGHGAELLPLLVQLLQLVEGAHHVLVLGELLRGLAESFLGLEVLAEVQVAQVAVDLDHVVELLHIELVGIVDVPECGGGHGARFPPAVLEFAESRELGAHIILTFYEGLELLDDGLLLGQILLPAGVLLLVEFGALLLVVCIQRLEILLHGLERIVLTGRRLVRHAALTLEAAQQLVESGLDRLRLLGTGHPLRAAFQFNKHVGELREGLVGKILDLVRDVPDFPGDGLGGLFGGLDHLILYICGDLADLLRNDVLAHIIRV